MLTDNSHESRAPEADTGITHAQTTVRSLLRATPTPYTAVLLVQVEILVLFSDRLPSLDFSSDLARLKEGLENAIVLV